ncbi:MAG: nicotinate-nucleotide--dimethylbenzimidazole phosphoribosyltransferase [Endomicrobiia bacterium]
MTKEKISYIINSISLPDYSLINKTQKLLDNLTKPKNSLGDLEEMAKKIAAITNNVAPKIKKKYLFVLAADHGVAEENVSAYPQEVTFQMVLNFIKKGAAINVFTEHTDTNIFIVDMGVKGDFSYLEKEEIFVDKKINPGTKNFLKEPAMSKDEAENAILCGIELVEKVLDLHDPENGEILLVGIGDMGIGNTTTASAITALITKTEVEKIVGRGTGVDDFRYKNKIEVIKKVLNRYEFNLNDAVDILSKIGGYEIAGMVGIILACARYKIPLVLDGFITTSAALVALCMSEKIKEYLFAGHLSREPGHRIQLEFLGLKPILNLNMALGEGTGACLAMDILELSCKILHEMSTFDEARVSRQL